MMMLVPEIGEQIHKLASVNIFMGRWVTNVESGGH